MNQYIDTMFWSSTDDKDQPMDKNYTAGDLSAEAKAQIQKDCETFLDKAGDIIYEDYSQAGHDFWLTRNGHGAGFWDGQWDHLGKEVVKQLVRLSKSFGEQDLYIGDDGKLYLS